MERASFDRRGMEEDEEGMSRWHRHRDDSMMDKFLNGRMFQWPGNHVMARRCVNPMSMGVRGGIMAVECTLILPC